MTQTILVFFFGGGGIAPSEALIKVLKLFEAVNFRT